MRHAGRFQLLALVLLICAPLTASFAVVASPRHRLPVGCTVHDSEKDKAYCAQPSLRRWHRRYPRNMLLLRLSANPEGGSGGDSPSPSSSTSSEAKPMTPTERILANEKMDAATRAVVEAAAKRQAAENGSAESKYPIDLPSPILLASSMILAIVSTGSLFELVGGSSLMLPFAATAAIAAIGIPLAIFLLLAAIAKATAETEEDDKKFLSGK